MYIRRLYVYIVPVQISVLISLHYHQYTATFGVPVKSTVNCGCDVSLQQMQHYHRDLNLG